MGVGDIIMRVGDIIMGEACRLAMKTNTAFFQHHGSFHPLLLCY